MIICLSYHKQNGDAIS
uniref:Uncharacterized protein n=1 Tax=Rhizophora mucronata TaxID=61149 RepID=A0A2P2PBE7_RHIMU